MKTETELKQRIALLTKVLDDVVEYNEAHTSSTDHTEIKKILEPYLASKIQPWTKWKIDNYMYMLCRIDGKYQLNALDGYSSWAGLADTPLGAFANSFHGFTKVED